MSRTGKDTGYRVGLIGADIQGSLSPALHEREAAELGIEYAYELFDLEIMERPAEDIGALIGDLRKEALRGVNVTHPCKQLAARHLDSLSSQAEALGAVNTVVFDAGRATGHNTDWPGFAEGFRRGMPGAALGDVVLVGAGGAG